MNRPLAFVSCLGLAFCAAGILLTLGPEALVNAVVFPVVGVLGVAAVAAGWYWLDRRHTGRR